MGPEDVIWPEVIPEYFEIRKEGAFIGDIALKKGERYLFFNGHESGKNLINMDSISKYLPKELVDSLVVYNAREMRQNQSRADWKIFSKVDRMTEKLKETEVLESRKKLPPVKFKEGFNKMISNLKKENEKKSQEGRASIRGKLAQNKDIVKKNQSERKEPTSHCRNMLNYG